MCKVCIKKGKNLQLFPDENEYLKIYNISDYTECFLTQDVSF